MEGKLIKTENGYGLKDCELIAFVSSRRLEHKHHKLSLTNCQAIECGYDLDELADEYSDVFDAFTDDRFDAFKAGFQKALELMRDRKFTEDDMRKAYRKGEYDAYYVGAVSEKENNYIQSIQQTEWDCIIFVDEKTNQPLLDNEGNLILKRK